MATASSPENDDGDEYGSDFDDFDTDCLTTSAGVSIQVRPAPSTPASAIRTAGNAPLPSTRVLRSQAKVNFDPKVSAIEISSDSEGISASPSITPANNKLSDIEATPPVIGQGGREAVKSTGEDTRSPLDRYRRGGRKALSVTDFVSPSWCELQFAYTLSKWGRKRPTESMKSGTAVHKKLEEEVHRVVSVEIQTKEDNLGLRIWNVIQGLQCLRQTGMTRELEVWGILDGQMVIGVIDEISFICPDRELEAQAMQRAGLAEGTASLPDQRLITDFLSQVGGNEYKALKSREQQRANGVASKVYISDVKTRANGTMPPKGATFRSTMIQLMLYRRLLSDVVSENFKPEALWSHFSVEPETPFSDAFIAQIGSMNEVFFDSQSDPSSLASSQESGAHGSLDLLLKHNTLDKLWDLLQSQLQLVFPAGAASIGEVLKVEYRGAKDGQIIGAKTFLHEELVVDSHVEDQLLWWRGERTARGVEVEEAFKCGICEFKDDCDWRKQKVQDQLEKARLRRAGSGTRSTV